MKHLTIAHRIMLTIAAAVLSMLLVGLIGLKVSNTQTEDIRLIEQDSLAGISTLSEARQAFMMIRLSVLNHISSPDPATKKPPKSESNSTRRQRGRVSKTTRN